LQFHLETTIESAKLIIENCRNEIVEGIYTQAEVEILTAPDEQYLLINSLMGSVLEYLHVNNSQHEIQM
jgi:hypothetical protein